MVVIKKRSGESIILGFYGESVIVATLQDKRNQHSKHGHVTDVTDAINYCPTCAEIERLLAHLRG